MINVPEKLENVLTCKGSYKAHDVKIQLWDWINESTEICMCKFNSGKSFAI